MSIKSGTKLCIGSYLVVAFSFILMSPHAFAQPDLDASISILERGCDFVRKIPSSATIWNADGRIGVTRVTFCKAKDGANVVFFQAAARHKQAFRGIHSSPFMHVRFLDKNGVTLWEATSAWTVDIPACGGYQFHMHRVPNANWASRVDHIKVSMGGATPLKECMPDPWADIIATAAAAVRAVRDCNTLKKADEQEICRFLKSTGAVVAGAGGG